MVPAGGHATEEAAAAHTCCFETFHINSLHTIDARGRDHLWRSNAWTQVIIMEAEDPLVRNVHKSVRKILDSGNYVSLNKSSEFLK